MPHNDDTDRFCPVCKGARRLTDTATHEYGYSARSLTPCWSCYVPEEPQPVVGPDALVDAALASMGMTRAQWNAERWAEFHGEDA